MGLIDERLRERFAEKVDLVPFSTCHYWNGMLNSAGYGIFSANGRRRSAHRLSYEMAKGPIPEIDGRPAVILHSCDTPCCVNPAHLSAGTQLDNIEGMRRKGRSPRREWHWNSKLTPEGLQSLCRDIAHGRPDREIAATYGLSAARISTIRHGRAYAEEYAAAGGIVPTGRADRRVSDNDARAIYRRAYAGESSKALAQEFAVSPSFVADIKRGATYASVTGHRR